MSIFTKIFGDPNAKIIDELSLIIDVINSLESQFEKLSNDELKSKTSEFKKRLLDSSDDRPEENKLSDILPEAFALVREASKRTLNQRHFDVQLIGGIVLHRGQISEMKTGEGKTLVATLPAYLNALTGKGVHLVTVNDYLARRDASWMAQIYDALGLTVGCINHDISYLYDATWKNTDDDARDELGSFKVAKDFLRPCTRREAYAADITYGTNNEYGFDYLRDNMTYRTEDMVQREHNFAIVDEVDSILIDEARTPLIISIPDEESGELYKTFAHLVPKLKENIDYNIDEKLKAVTITEEGIEKVESLLGVSDIYTEKGMRFVRHLEQALRAKTLYIRDRDYVVKNGEVIIVDEFTGRLMPGRRWSEGLHQAVEAKESVIVQKESRTLATITFQNYFRLYSKLGGMTGTAITSAEELHKVYNLEVIQIPTNKPMIRNDRPDRIYQTEDGKWHAVAREIKERHAKGQPVLVGTVSIDKNERLSAILSRDGISHKMLNAKNHEEEGAIIAQAGRLNAVTVATNMAGRGVDIILGGIPQDSEQNRMVREVGGLAVLGTERHEARRIDDQLRGRAGRQGDSGESQFFVSLEDDLMRIFGPGPERIKGLMARLGISEDEAIENKMISRSIESAQGKIEGFNFDTRKHVLEYDDVMNKQRISIYGRRKRLLFASQEEIEREIFSVIKDFIRALLGAHAHSDYPSEWNIEEIKETLRSVVGDQLLEEQKLYEKISQSEHREDLENTIYDFLAMSFVEKKNASNGYLEIARGAMLQAMDALWIDHLEAMDYLRNSVRLRAYGQRDPLVEYKNEGAQMFRTLEGHINGYIVNLLFKIQAQPMQEIRLDNVQYQKPSAQAFGGAPPSHKATADAQFGNRASGASQIGRNDPCPCGSGKKYKRCHGK
ncbi:MAG: preprotein translocase subunit SecA [Patescibacteria group bacterium]